MFELCCYLGAAYLKSGERLVFVESNTIPDRVRGQISAFGVDVDEHERNHTFVIVDAYCPDGAVAVDPTAVKVRDTSNLEEVVQRISEAIVKVGGRPVKVMFDSLTPFYMHQDPAKVGHFFGAVSGLVRVSGNLTTAIHRGLLKDDVIDHASRSADGLIEMMVDDHFRRFVRIKRMKGVKVSPRWVPFEFEIEDHVDGAFLSWRRPGK